MRGGEAVAAPTRVALEGSDGGMFPRSFALWVVALYMALFVIRPWEALFPELGEFAFERWMVIITVLVVAFLRPFFAVSQQALAILALLAAVWISSLDAIYPDIASEERVEFFGTVLSFFLIVAVARSPYQLFFLVACYLVSMFVYLGKSEWEYFVNGAAQYRMGVFRLVGTDLTFGGPNELAASCLLTLPFVRMLYLSRDEFCADWSPRWKNRFSLFLLGYAALAFTAILLTRSRAGMMGFIFFVLLLAWYRKGITRKLYAFMIGAIALLIAFVAMPTDMRDRLQTVWDPEAESRFDQGGATTSAWGRWYGFVAGVEIFQRHPVTGVGIGNFKDYRGAMIDGEVMSAHNLPGELMAEIGAIGVVAFLFFLYALNQNCGYLRRFGRRVGAGQALALGRMGEACQIALLLLLFGGLSDHNLQRYQWMWVAAFAVASVRFARKGVAEASEEEIAPGLVASARPAEIST